MTRKSESFSRLPKSLSRFPDDSYFAQVTVTFYTGRILLAALIIVGSVVLVNMAKKPAPPAIELEESV